MSSTLFVTVYVPVLTHAILHLLQFLTLWDMTICDTGSENHYQNILYGDNPLWDGAGCCPCNTCCFWNSPPCLLKKISPPISDDIEIRMCTDQAQSDEDDDGSIYLVCVE